MTGAGQGPPDAGTGPLVPGQRFGERYTIVRLLGLGGMGAVYQAWDEELGVVVALKVIRPEAAAHADTAQALERRFKQELLLARKVTHKNVVRIHDLGEVQGIKYITMPYIEGEDLASILKREGKLPVETTLRIARSMMSGLAAAHAAGVVHRDLKPANIMVDTDGEAMIMDFGIARSTGGPALRGMERGASRRSVDVEGGQTVTGAVIGTVQYMAPEQARAEPVDHRADIYAAGLILYDMLAGRRRFAHAESAIAELTRRLLEPPPSLRTIDPSIPEPLERLVNRCLQASPADRYQTTEALIADLERLDDRGLPKPLERRITRRMAAAVAAAFLVLLGATWWLARGPAAPAPEPPPISVLVADFENHTGDPVFTGTVEQALNIAIEGASFVSAYPRPQARRIAEQIRREAVLDEAMARLIARRESLNVVLAGSVSVDGSRYRIDARALDMSRPDGQDVVATVSASAAGKGEILQAVEQLAGQLRRRLGDTSEDLSASGPSESFTAASLDAMRAYVRGQNLQVAGRFDEALAAYGEAVARDPGFGRAYAGMGVIYGNLKQYEKAEEHYQLALKHLNRMTEREKHATLGSYYLLVSRDYTRAIESYKELVEKFPADRGGHANLAYAYLNVRRMDDAVVEVRKALELEPGNMLQRMNYAMYSLYAGDFETAIAESRRIPPDGALGAYAVYTEARATAAALDLSAAREILRRLEGAAPPGPDLAREAAIDLDLLQGRYRETAAALEREVAAAAAAGKATETAPRLVQLAEAYRALGRGREAVAAARQAAEYSRQESVLLPAAFVLIDAGERGAAEGIAAELDNRLQAQSRAYARIIRAEIDRAAGRLPPAVDALRDAQARYDSWFVHFSLGRTYFDARDYAAALAEFDLCFRRRGEAADVFFADGSTLRYAVPVLYWLGRTQEALGMPEARHSFERYIELRGGTDIADPLLADARERLAGGR